MVLAKRVKNVLFNNFNIGNKKLGIPKTTGGKPFVLIVIESHFFAEASVDLFSNGIVSYSEEEFLRHLARKGHHT